MSDRVQFATWEYLYSKSGFSGFPIRASSAPNSLAIESFWRVKKWRLSVSGRISGSVTGQPNHGRTGSPNFTHELDLLSPEPTFGYPYGGCSFGTTNEDGRDVYGSVSPDGIYFGYTDDWYYADSRFNFPSNSNEAAPVEIDPAFNVGTFTFTVGGLTAIADVYGYYYPGPDSEDTPWDEGSLSGTLTAEEWWPYANSENLPVWSTSTGAQLRDPLS